MTHVDLARFRAGCANCELAMLVDLSAGTVLLSDSALPTGQERLDHLCRFAQTVLAGELPATGTAIVSGPIGSKLFVQSPHTHAEGLCALFGPLADLALACDAAQALFETVQTE